MQGIAPSRPLSIRYRIRATFPINAKTPESTVYEYYNPENRDKAAPQDVSVTG